MTSLPDNDLGFARLDLDRLRRTGDPEVVLASHKTPEQTAISLSELARAHPDRAVLATRCDAITRAECRERLPGAWIDDCGQTVVLGPLPDPRGTVAVVTGGTSDLPVAREAMVTAQVFGSGAIMLADLGWLACTGSSGSGTLSLRQTRSSRSPAPTARSPELSQDWSVSR